MDEGRAHDRRPARHRAPARRASGQGAGQQSPRGQNLSLVLRHVISAPEPVSRAEVAAATGLTRATVSTLVEWLLAAGLLAEQVPSTPQGAGRPAVPLVPARGAVAAVGAEIGIDYLGVRVLDLAGQVLAETVEGGDLRGADPAEVLLRLGRLVDEAVDSLDPARVRLAGGGLALPGLIDAGTGTVRIAPNLGWRDVDVAALWRAGGHPMSFGIELGNEADLAARAEAHARRNSGPMSFIYVSGEVGVGSAIVLEGELLRGRHGWSGEIGHTALGTTGSLRDGGTLEEYAGKDAILRSAHLLPTTSVAELVTRADAGEPRVVGAIDRAGDALGVALANAANLVDVQDVVLGGMYAGLGRHLRGPVLAQLAARLISAPWVSSYVHVATAGPYPAMTGAALAALSPVLADPLSWSTLQGPRSATGS